MQSGLPYSIYSVEPELANSSQYGDLVRGSGGLYRLGFGRPSLCGSLDELRQHGDDPTEAAFNKSVLCSPIDGRRRIPGQPGIRQSRPQRAARLLAAARRPQPREGLPVRAASRNVEIRWDVFNVFNTVNYALPNNVIGSASTDFGKITDSVGGPRVMQLGARVRF